jgi:hypothetical protein
MSPNKRRILLSDIFDRRRPVDLVRESYPMRGGTLSVIYQLCDRPPSLIGGYAVHSIFEIHMHACATVPRSKLDVQSLVKLPSSYTIGSEFQPLPEFVSLWRSWRS